MTLPPVDDPRWRTFLTRPTSQHYEFLALNLVLTGTHLSLLRDPGPSNVEQAVLRVRGLLERNGQLPSVQRDLALIFGETK